MTKPKFMHSPESDHLIRLEAVLAMLKRQAKEDLHELSARVWERDRKLQDILNEAINGRALARPYTALDTIIKKASQQ